MVVAEGGFCVNYINEIVQLCIDALKMGSLPIGCVIVNGSGNIISKGMNAIHESNFSGYPVFGNSIAHAELNALVSMKRIPDNMEISDYVIYTSMEPCVMCFGAIYMSGIRNVVYGMKDGVGGGLNLYGVTEYYGKKKINIVQNKKLEKMQAVLFGFMRDKDYINRGGLWQTYLSMYSEEYKIAEQLRKNEIYGKLLAGTMNASQFISVVEKFICDLNK